VDPSSLKEWSKEGGDLLHSMYQLENTLNEACQEFDSFATVLSIENSVINQKGCVSISGFVCTMLDLKLLSGAPSLDSEAVRIQY
jgi:hypothetical protein